MIKNEKRNIKRSVNLFTLTGLVVGSLFPIFAYAMDQFKYNGSLLNGNLFSTHPLYLIIATAPLVLAILGFVIGKYSTKLSFLNVKLTAAGWEIEELSLIVKDLENKESVEKLKNFLPKNLEVISLKNTLFESVDVIHKMKSTLTNRSSEFLLVLANIISKRDDVTGEHNYRVALALSKMVEKYENNTGYQFNKYNIIKGALLHDIGKISIPDEILLKPGKFNSKEREIMESHTKLGSDIVSQFDQLKDARDIIMFHHEKWDGSGYPIGLKGDQIPIETRMFSIVDVFDALMSKRPYKTNLSVKKALSIMEENTGTQFCPESMEIFKEIVDDLVKLIYSKNSFDIYDKVVNLISENSKFKYTKS